MLNEEIDILLMDAEIKEEKMKKTRLFIIASLILTMAFMLIACSGSNYSFTQSGNKLTISANATDGAEQEYEAIEVGPGQVVNIESALEQGELEIEFVEAVNTKTSEDEDDDYALFDTAATVTVGPGSTESVQLAEGAYVLEIESTGETKGDVIITID